VTLKLKTAAFEVRTRRASLAAPTQLAQALFRTARALLAREAHGPRYRLIGVGLSDLSEAGADAADLADLADPAALKRAHAERAADRARSRFGPGVVTTGRGLSAAARRRGARAHDKPAADR
jgi:DNA polymerase-4